MCTSTAATTSPVRRATSYPTRERIVAATSARLRPYSSDDVEVDHEPVRAGVDLDPLRQPVAREHPRDPALAGHVDDAVALGSRVPDDLGDGFGRDRDPPELGCLGQVRPLHAATLDGCGRAEVAA